MGLLKAEAEGGTYRGLVPGEKKAGEKRVCLGDGKQATCAGMRVPAGGKYLLSGLIVTLEGHTGNPPQAKVRKGAPSSLHYISSQEGGLFTEVENGRSQETRP